MATPRWEPFREMQRLRDMMEHMLPEGLHLPTTTWFGVPGGSMPLDVLEREDEFVVRAALPGARPDDVQVTLRGHVLTVQGHYAHEEDLPGARWILRERRTDAFYRTVVLPAEVDADHASARFRLGVLELRLPKAHVARARQIKVEGAAPAEHDGPSGSPGAAATERSDRPTAHGDANDTVWPNGSADRVTEASEDSFPASDPPSWSPNRT